MHLLLIQQVSPCLDVSDICEGISMDHKNPKAYRAVINVVDDIKHDLMSLCLPLVLIDMTEKYKYYVSTCYFAYNFNEIPV